MNPIGILDPEGKELNPLTNESYGEDYKIFAENWSNLPMYLNKTEETINAIYNNNVILITSGTVVVKQF